MKADTMLNILIILMQTAAPLPTTPAASSPRLPVLVALPLAERPRGIAVSDRSGSPLGVVDASDATKVILVVGPYKLALPANALQKVSGRVSASITRQQVEKLMAASTAYQIQAHPVPKAVAAPKGFTPLKALSPPPVDK